MKIYTEVNYKWIDGRLVETSSKSFEYTGNLTLCGGGGGGGGKGGGGGGGGLTGITDAVGGAVGDVTSAVTTEAGNVGTIVAEGVSDTIDPITSNVTDAANMANENIATGTEALTTGVSEGINEVATTTSTNLAPVMAEGQRFGDTLDTNMQPIVEEGTRWTKAGQAGIDAGLGFIHDKLISVGDNPDSVDVKKGAIRGGLKGRDKSELAVNKSQKRARKSLRIG